jgi:hypothetical protein
LSLRKGRLGSWVGALARLAERQPRVVAVAGMGYFLALLVGTYVFLITPTYFYSGLVNLAPADGSLIVAIALAWLPSLVMPLTVERPYHAGLWLLYVLTYAPAQIVPHFVLGTGWSLLPLNLTLAAGMLLLLAGQSIPALRVPRPHLSPVAFRVLATAGSILLLAIILAYFGLTPNLPSLTDVAATRDEYREEIEGAPRIVSYAVSWAGRIVLPVVIAAGIWWRRWWLVALGGIGEIYIYSISGFRSLLLAVGIVIGMLVLARYIGRRWGPLLPSLAATGIVLAAIPTVVGVWLPISLFVRRLVDVPGQLIGYYYDFFSKNDPYLLSHSILGWLFQPPSEADPPSVIGVVYFHDPRIHANGNFWADGMANFGLAGIIVMSLLAVALLVVMDSAARGRTLALVVAIFGAAMVTLTNSGLLTSIGTHGIGLAVLLVALLPLADARQRSPEAASA